jgi:hypothetical protein
MRELFMTASFDRLRLRLPDPEPSPVGLANAGFPLRRGRRFFLGLGEEGGGPIYPSGSRRVAGPQRRTASPKPCSPIEEGFLTSRTKIQAQSLCISDSAVLYLINIQLLLMPDWWAWRCNRGNAHGRKSRRVSEKPRLCATLLGGSSKCSAGVPTRDSPHLKDAGEGTHKTWGIVTFCHLSAEPQKPISYR